MSVAGTLKGRTKTRKSRSDALQKPDWVAAARKLLIKRGISNVKIEPLAEAMSVTTGSFYWHFSGRPELHDALLKDWYDTNTAPFYTAVRAASPDPRRQYLAFFGVWVLERDFDPKYDQAIRDWARTSKKVADLLREVDNTRIRLLIEIFENFGYSGLEAEMRARVTYYHQLGYYAMHVREARDRRFELAPFYADILTGHPWMHALQSVEDIREGMQGNASFQDDWTKLQE
nr:Bacterial regulatory proteins, tetR family [uncultured bacterium]